MSDQIQAWVDDDFKQKVDVEASKRGISTSELLKEAVESKINSSSLEDELDIVENKLRNKKEERQKLEAEISRLESEKESIEKRLQGQNSVNQKYEDLVQQVASDYLEYNPNSYTASQHWDSVLELADSEEVARADVEDKIESLRGDRQ